MGQEMNKVDISATLLFLTDSSIMSTTIIINMAKNTTQHNQSLDSDAKGRRRSA